MIGKRFIFITCMIQPWLLHITLDDRFQVYPIYSLFSFVKMTPFAWQLASFILRWLGILFIYFTLNTIWPKRAWLHKWVGVLLFVFPGYLEQLVAVCFSRHLSAFLLFAGSLYLTILAIKNRKLFWLWMPLSVIMGVSQVFMLEYFAILEIIRPLLIWFMLRSRDVKKKDAFLKTLLYWSPFVLGLGYLYLVAAGIHPYNYCHRPKCTLPFKNFP